jgi:hypothetical protein
MKNDKVLRDHSRHRQQKTGGRRGGGVWVGKKEVREANMKRPSGPLVLPVLLGMMVPGKPRKVQKMPTMEVQ